ncbi:MAG: hypothetical protein FJ405_04025 [Verrucomicrobia bacterium]|nr:hypothetical protein [Verrucomicrobiota bacterium]
MSIDGEPRFPAVVVYDDGLTAYELGDDLMVCRKTDLNAGSAGKYAPSTIVDSDGVAWRVTGAEKLRAVGPFMGFNLFFNPSMRVRLKFEAAPSAANLDWLKGEVVKRLKKKDAFGVVLKIGATTIDSDPANALIPKVEQATSPSQIINVLLTADFPERQRWEQNPVR